MRDIPHEWEAYIDQSLEQAGIDDCVSWDITARRQGRVRIALKIELEDARDMVLGILIKEDTTFQDFVNDVERNVERLEQHYIENSFLT